MEQALRITKLITRSNKKQYIDMPEVYTMAKILYGQEMYTSFFRKCAEMFNNYTHRDLRDKAEEFLRANLEDFKLRSGPTGAFTVLDMMITARDISSNPKLVCGFDETLECARSIVVDRGQKTIDCSSIEAAIKILYESEHGKILEAGAVNLEFAQNKINKLPNGKLVETYTKNYLSRTYPEDKFIVSKDAICYLVALMETIGYKLV